MKCPFCAETIQDEASKCRFCGERITLADKLGYPTFYRNVARDGLGFGALATDYYLNSISPEEPSHEDFVLLSSNPFEMAFYWQDKIQWRADQYSKVKLVDKAYRERIKDAETGSDEAQVLLASERFADLLIYFLNPENQTPWASTSNNRHMAGIALPQLKETFSDLPERARDEFAQLIDGAIGVFRDKAPQQDKAVDEGVAGEPSPRALSAAPIEAVADPEPVAEALTTGARPPDSKLVWRVVGAGAPALIAIFLTFSYLHGGSRLLLRKPGALPAGVQAFPAPVNESLPSGPGALNVNVRSGPGKAFPSVEVMMAGSPLVEVGRAYDAESLPWIVVRRADGSYGFIKERLVHPAQSIAISTPPAPAAAGPSFRLTSVMMASDVLHGRPAFDSRNFAGPQTGMGIYGDYIGGRLGEPVQAVVRQNGVSMQSCAINIQYAPTGAIWCQVGGLNPGAYDFVILADGQEVGAYSFSVS